jgi:hypothetical protein
MSDLNLEIPTDLPTLPPGISTADYAVAGAAPSTTTPQSAASGTSPSGGAHPRRGSLIGALRDANTAATGIVASAAHATNAQPSSASAANAAALTRQQQTSGAGNATTTASSAAVNSSLLAEDAAAQLYFHDHEVIPMVNLLLTELFVARPADPIDFMMMWLMRHVEKAEREWKGMQNSLAQHQGEAVEYCVRYAIPELLEEMLSALVAEKPPDAVRFGASWLRWNKTKFVDIHKPIGYQQNAGAQ